MYTVLHKDTTEKKWQKFNRQIENTGNLHNNCPPFGTYLRIATHINKSSKLALEHCIETSNFAAIWLVENALY